MFKDAYVAELEHFIACILDGTEPRVGGVDGLRAVEAVRAANRSIAAGVPVEIESE